MTRGQGKAESVDLKAVKALIEADEDYVRAALQAWF